MQDSAQRLKLDDPTPPQAPKAEAAYTEPRLIRYGSLAEITGGGNGGPQGDLFSSSGFSV